MVHEVTQSAQNASVRSKEWYDSSWKILLRIVSNTVLVFAVALSVAIAVVPRVLGGHALTVLSGSMRPYLQPGDIAVTKGVTTDNVCSQVKVGDIVSFLPLPDDPNLVTHRVVEKSIGDFSDGTHCRLTTKGDDNSATDEAISPVQVRGVFLYRVPVLGWVQNTLGSASGLVVAAAAVAAIGYGLWLVFRRPRHNAREDHLMETDRESVE